MKRKMQLAAFALIAAAAVYPQNVDLQKQVRAPVPPPTVAQVFGFIPTVGFTMITVGSGLTVSGPPFVLAAPAGAGPVFVDGAVVTGTLDGANAIFALPSAPVPPSGLLLFRNGVLQRAGADFALSGNALTFTAGSIPQPGDALAAWYRR